MSVSVMSACWDLQLPHSEKLVLISLADQANDEGECWPSIATIMRRTGLSDRSLQRIIFKLEQRGLLRRHYRAGHSTRYVLPNPITPVTVTPRHSVTPVTVSPTPRHSVTPAPDILSGTPPTSCQGRTVIEPSVEPSINHSVAFRDDARAILQFLNERTGKRFKPTEANLSMIMARLKEGASMETCKQVIDLKRKHWLFNPEMADYLRPATLFNRTKFAQYEGELK